MSRRRVVLSACAFTLMMAVLPACSSTGKAIAQRGFVEAVNLHCRSTRARVEIAGKLATIASQTDQGKAMTAGAEARAAAAKAKAQALADQIGKIAGPTGLQTELIDGLNTLRAIPGQVSDGTLTTEQGMQQFEKTRADLRAKGFVDCV